MINAGDIYRDFIVTKFHDISEIESILLEIEHKTSGARIMILHNEDRENVFNLSFQTSPSTSNGVAHILEHTVLCGSKNYPVKDPFFSMIRRSLNTFMNAFTGSDFTCYPAASQCYDDFYNLLSVYIDAVFYPLLLKESFLQEGWRFDFADKEEKELIFNGIVFNEMKGALMSGEARLSEALNQAIFPNVTYGINSGGDPREIVSLQHSDLKNFHRKFYHPSHCLFYFYGNIRPEDHLDFLEEKLLRYVSKEDKLSGISNQKRFKTPKNEKYFYPAEKSMDQKYKVLFGISWLTCSILDQEDLLALNILDLVIMGTDAAPLKREILRSGLCKQTYSLIDNEIKEIPYTIVCKGCSSESAKQLEELIFNVLKEIAKQDLPQSLIEGAIHQLEISRKEISGHNLPYGLSLFFRSGLLKHHGGDPSYGLKIHSLFSSLRQRISENKFFSDLIKKYFIENKHYASVVMEPKTTLLEEEREKEKEVLLAIQQKMKPMDVEQIKEDLRSLEKYRLDKNENINLLPKISLDKIPRFGEDFPLVKKQYGDYSVYFHKCFTNDLVFIDLVFDLSSCSLDELPWLRLLCFLLPQLGSGGRNYQEQLDYLLQHTGGIDCIYDFSPSSLDNSKLNPSISFRGKVLREKMKHLFEIFKGLIVQVDFSDKERIKELLMQHGESLSNNVKNHPLSYAINLTCAALSSVSYLSYRTSGLPYVKMVLDIIENFDQKFDEIREKLIQIKEKFLGVNSVDLVLSCSELAFNELENAGFYDIFSICDKKLSPSIFEKDILKISSLGKIIPSSVAFNVLGFFTNLSYVDSDAPVLSIISELVENLVLHTKIREQGGAYGSGAVNHLSSGVFYFYSYRDPLIAETKKVFEYAINTIREGLFSDQDLHEAILGVIQDIDSPVSPGNRAAVSYFSLRVKKTKDIKQNFRSAILSINREAILSVAKKYFQMDQSVFISFSGEDLLRKNINFLDKNFEIQSLFL